MEHETFGVLQVVEQAAGCGDEQVHALLKLVCFGATFGSTNDNTVGLVVVLEAVAGPLVVVHGELSGWGDHEDASAVLLLDVGLSEQFDGGHHVGEGLA